MKKLVIHMGAHRCGSTAIQSMLRRELVPLANQGIRVHLRADMAARGMDFRRLHRYRSMNPLWQAKLQDIATRLAAMTEDMLLASEENLMGTMPAVRGHGFYPHFDQLVRGLAKLDAMTGNTIQIAPRLVVRRQDHYLESVYAFRVSRGLTKTFDTFLASVGGTSISWLRLAKLLAALPGTCVPSVAILETWPKPSAANKALEFLIGPNDVPLSARRLTGNTRYSSAQLRFILALNQAKIVWQDAGWREGVVGSHAGDGALQKLKDCISASEYARFLQQYSPEAKIGFSDTERAQFLADYAQKNQEFFSLPIVCADAGIWDADT